MQANTCFDINEPFEGRQAVVPVKFRTYRGPALFLASRFDARVTLVLSLTFHEW